MKPHETKVTDPALNKTVPGAVNQPVITLSGIKKNYQGKTVLDIEFLEFQKSRIYAILGPNGSGKTTMFRIMTGLEKPDLGEVVCKSEISCLTQEIYLFDMTVIKNMTIALGNDALSQQEAMTALEKVNMQEFAGRKTRSLSGGEKQRVAIARTLSQKKEIILLDEPAASVDTLSTTLTEKYIKETKEQSGSTIIFTTHSPAQALRIADEIIIMWNGCPIERGAPKDVFDHPVREETKEFLQNWRV